MTKLYAFLPVALAGGLFMSSNCVNKNEETAIEMKDYPREDVEQIRLEYRQLYENLNLRLDEIERKIQERSVGNGEIDNMDLESENCNLDFGQNQDVLNNLGERDVLIEEYPYLGEGVEVKYREQEDEYFEDDFDQYLYGAEFMDPTYEQNED